MKSVIDRLATLEGRHSAGAKRYAVLIADEVEPGLYSIEELYPEITALFSLDRLWELAEVVITDEREVTDNARP